MNKKTQVTLHSYSLLIILGVVIAFSFGAWFFMALKSRNEGQSSKSNNSPVVVQTDTNSLTTKDLTSASTPESSPTPPAVKTNVRSDGKLTTEDGFAIRFDGTPYTNVSAPTSAGTTSTEYAVSSGGNDYSVIVLVYNAIPQAKITKTDLDSMLESSVLANGFETVKNSIFYSTMGDGSLDFFVYNSANKDYMDGRVVTKSRGSQFYVYIVSAVSTEQDPVAVTNFVNSFELL